MVNIDDIEFRVVKAVDTTGGTANTLDVLFGVGWSYEIQYRTAITKRSDQNGNIWSDWKTMPVMLQT